MRAWHVLLALPFAGLLYPPLYAKTDPELLGFPFFYWYQLAALGSALALFLYPHALTATLSACRPRSPCSRAAR